MSTPVPQKILKEGVKTLSVLQFNFYDVDSDNIAERKGNFELKFVNRIRDIDGGVREDENGLLILSGDETKLMMRDSVELESGVTLTGADVAECLGIVADRAWEGNYKYTPEPVEDDIEL